MSNTKSTKRALLYSIMAMLICVAMLIGTTFAWFTDSVTSRGNIIKSGNLKISATYQDASAAGTISYTVPGFTRTADNTIKFSADTTDINESNKIIEEDLWEPGAVGAKLIIVHNDGNLAAKIKLNFTVYDGGLQNALWYDFIMVNGNQVVGNFTKREMSTLSAFAGAVELPLMPKDEDGDSVSFILIYGMKEEAGNEYQGKSFSADVTIFATQDTYETDSFDNQYDKEAEQLLEGKILAQDIKNAKPGETVELAGDVMLDEQLKINNSITIDGKGYRIRYNGTGYAFSENSRETADIVVQNCVFEKPANTWANTVVSGITYKDCTFNGGNVYVTPTKQNRTITIEGCTFNDAMLTLDFMNTVERNTSTPIDGTLNAVLKNNTFNITTSYDNTQMHTGVGIAMFIREDSGFYGGADSKVNITMQNNDFVNQTGDDTYCAYQIIQTWAGNLTETSTLPDLTTGNTFETGAMYSWANYNPWAAWTHNIQ